jgi:hypothetical protein
MPFTLHPHAKSVRTHETPHKDGSVELALIVTRDPSLSRADYDGLREWCLRFLASTPGYTSVRLNPP